MTGGEAIRTSGGGSTRSRRAPSEAGLTGATIDTPSARRPSAFIDVCHSGHRRFLQTVDQLPDGEMEHPSLLPGWSRAHVVAWLTLKSRSHVYVLDGAMLGEVQSQFPGDYDQSSAVRQEVILGAKHLREALTAAFDELEAVWNRLPDRLWASTGITTAGPRSMAEIVTRHLRDLEVHHVDLDAGYTPSNWPPEFVEFELTKRLPDLERRADQAALLAWLLGRQSAPELRPW